MEQNVKKAIGDVLDALITTGASKAAKYLSDKLVVRVARPTFGPIGKKRVLRDTNIQVVLTIGRPNFEQRRFIKLAKKAREAFPVKKVQLKFPSGSKKRK